MDWLALSAALAALAAVALCQVFNIRSQSMWPTLHTNDRLLVVRCDRTLRRGDIVALRFRKDVDVDDDRCNEWLGFRVVVKRVVALAGDTLNVCGDMVTVHSDGAGGDRVESTEGASAEGQQVLIPADSVYVAGDHRRVSYDSRDYGPVRTNAVIGIASAVIWPPARVCYLRRGERGVPWDAR